MSALLELCSDAIRLQEHKEQSIIFKCPFFQVSGDLLEKIVYMLTDIVKQNRNICHRSLAIRA